MPRPLKSPWRHRPRSRPPLRLSPPRRPLKLRLSRSCPRHALCRRRASTKAPSRRRWRSCSNEQATEIRSLKHGDVVEGNVVRIDKDEILVDIGAKSEGVISNRELYGRNAESQPQLNIGDQVLVYVLQPEST